MSDVLANRFAPLADRLEALNGLAYSDSAQLVAPCRAICGAFFAAAPRSAAPQARAHQD